MSQPRGQSTARRLCQPTSLVPELEVKAARFGPYLDALKDGIQRSDVFKRRTGAKLSHELPREHHGGVNRIEGESIIKTRDAWHEFEIRDLDREQAVPHNDDVDIRRRQFANTNGGSVQRYDAKCKRIRVVRRRNDGNLNTCQRHRIPVARRRARQYRHVKSGFAADADKRIYRIKARIGLPAGRRECAEQEKRTDDQEAVRNEGIPELHLDGVFHRLQEMDRKEICPNVTRQWVSSCRSRHDVT